MRSMKIREKFRLWNKKRKLRRERPQVYFVENEFAYIQIPKTGSRSLQEAVTRYLMQREGLVPGDIRLDKNLVKSYEERYSSHLSSGVIAGISREVFTFALVRNPLERLYSCYKNKVLKGGQIGARNIFEKHGIPLDIGFSEFLLRVDAIPDNVSDRHFRSQSWFLSHKGKLLPIHIVKLEELSQAWPEVERRTGIAAPPRFNRSEKRPLPELSAEERRIINNRYHDDFVNFGYEFV